MSIEHPETLEEWKNFRFPTRDRSTLAQTLRDIALANGELIEDDEEEEGEGSGGGSAGPALLEGLIGYQPADERRPDQVSPPPVAVEPPLTATGPVEPPPLLPDRVEGSSVSTSPPPDATGDSWSYDAARGLLINWRIGKTLILAKMDKVEKLLEYAKLVEKSKIDRPGFESSLDQACQDIHGQPLATILKNWDPKSALAWGEMPEKAILPPTRPRRRAPAH